jgi:hypothetical protein
LIIFNESVTVVRAGSRVDRGGNTVPDWSPGAVTRHAVTRVSVQPNTQNEQADPTRNAIVTGWRVYTMPGTDADVLATDRIEWDGMTLEVVGEVARWKDPIGGGIHHVEFTMQRAQG